MSNPNPFLTSDNRPCSTLRIRPLVSPLDVPESVPQQGQYLYDHAAFLAGLGALEVEACRAEQAMCGHMPWAPLAFYGPRPDPAIEPPPLPPASESVEALHNSLPYLKLPRGIPLRVCLYPTLASQAPLLTASSSSASASAQPKRLPPPLARRVSQEDWHK